MNIISLPRHLISETLSAYRNVIQDRRKAKTMAALIVAMGVFYQDRIKKAPTSIQSQMQLLPPIILLASAPLLFPVYGKIKHIWEKYRTECFLEQYLQSPNTPADRALWLATLCGKPNHVHTLLSRSIGNNPSQKGIDIVLCKSASFYPNATYNMTFCFDTNVAKSHSQREISFTIGRNTLNNRLACAQILLDSGRASLEGIKQALHLAAIHRNEDYAEALLHANREKGKPLSLKKI